MFSQFCSNLTKLLDEMYFSKYLIIIFGEHHRYSNNLVQIIIWNVVCVKQNFFSLVLLRNLLITSFTSVVLFISQIETDRNERSLIGMCSYVLTLKDASTLKQNKKPATQA